MDNITDGQALVFAVLFASAVGALVGGVERREPLKGALIGAMWAACLLVVLGALFFIASLIPI